MVFSMRFALPEGTFPPFQLSQAESRSLSVHAERVIYETIAAEEACNRMGKAFPRNEWKLIRVKEKIHVYQERLGKTKPIEPPNYIDTIDYTQYTDSSSNDSVSSAEDLALQKPSHVPLLVAHGTLDGTLDDVMHGVMANDDQTWRIRSVYMNDKCDDAKILTTIHGPQDGNPFRFLGIKWFTKEHPVALTPFVQRRDFVILSATGIARDSHNRPVGFCLFHSIDLPQVRELTETSIIRGKLSFCYIVRQSRPNKVDIYCRGYSDPRGGMPMSVSSLLAAESIVAAANAIECSVMKKLMWLMQRKQSLAERSPEEDNQCKACRRHFHKFGSFGSGANCRMCHGVRTVALCIYANIFSCTHASYTHVHLTIIYAAACVLPLQCNQAAGRGQSGAGGHPQAAALLSRVSAHCQEAQRTGCGSGRAAPKASDRCVRERGPV